MGIESELTLEQSMKWLHWVCEQYRYGSELYNIFVDTLNGANEKTGMIVSPANLGDTVFIASLAETYKRVHGISKLIIVAKNRQAEAVKWFSGVDGVFGMSDEEIVALRYYFTVSKNFYSNGIRYGHIPCSITYAYPGTFIHDQPGFGGDTLKHVWEKRILDIPENSPTSNLVIPQGIKPSTENYEKYRNAVLIAPAAFTNKGIPESFWEMLTERLIGLGYEVYNNSGGLDYDKIIKGTEPFYASTQDLILNAPLFKHVIAVRSGFTDLVSKTSAQMTVLHLSNNQNVSLRIELGVDGSDVRDLGRLEGIYPLYHVTDREHELMELIIENIG